jgi:hypothetical protein
LPCCSVSDLFGKETSADSESKAHATGNPSSEFPRGSRVGCVNRVGIWRKWQREAF